MKTTRRLLLVPSLLLGLFLFSTGHKAFAQTRPLQKVRIGVPAKTVTFLPFYFGKEKGFFENEGIDLQLVIMRSPLSIVSLQTGEIDYTAAASSGMRTAVRGIPLKAVIFMQTRLSFSLIGQRGMTAKDFKTVAIGSIGSLGHYAAQAAIKKLGRGGPGDEITFIQTGRTANSFQALVGKSVRPTSLRLSLPSRRRPVIPTWVTPLTSLVFREGP